VEDVQERNPKRSTEMGQSGEAEQDVDGKSPWRRVSSAAAESRRRYQEAKKSATAREKN
jgi:hypothetical protein